MESSYNESMINFDLSYFDNKNEVPKKPNTIEAFLRLKKKIISTDAILKYNEELKKQLIHSRNECKQIRIDHEETTRRLESIKKENKEIKIQTNETLQKQNHDNLQLQGLQSYIKQLQELVAEKEAKIGSIELEKQLLLSTVQDLKREHKKALRSNIKEKNRKSSDTVASFTPSDFEIEPAYSIDTGCGSSIASITSPDYSSNNSPISLDCLHFQKSACTVSVATSPIEFLTSVPDSESELPKICADEYSTTQSLVSTSNEAVEADANEHATSTECLLNVSPEPEPSKISFDEYTSTQSLSRLNEALETDANESIVSAQYLINRLNVAVQTESGLPKIVSDKYTNTETLTNLPVETAANHVTNKEDITPVEDMEVQSILHMMTMTFPAVSPIPPSPVILKDASTQFCSVDHCDISSRPSKNISTNRKKSVDSNYVPLLENKSADPDNILEICLNASPVESNTNKSIKKQTDVPLSNNTLDDNDRLNYSLRKSPSNKHISKGKQIDDLKNSKTQKLLHDLGLSESDSDIDDSSNLNEIGNMNSSNKTYPEHKDLKAVTLSKVNTVKVKSCDVYDANKIALRNNNSIENCQPENTVQSPKTRKELPPLKSISVKIEKMNLDYIEKYPVIAPFESKKVVTRKSISGDFRKEIDKDLGDNLISSSEKTIKSPKATEELFSPDSDCGKNDRVLRKRISSTSNKDTKLRNLYEDLGLSGSDSEVSNPATSVILDEVKDYNKSQNLTKSTDISENHVRNLRSKSRRQSALLANPSSSENQRPRRHLKRKCSVREEFSCKVSRNNRTNTNDSGLNTVEIMNNLKEPCGLVDSPSVTLRKTRQGSLSNNKCKKALCRHKDSEYNDMEIKEIEHKEPICLEKIQPKELSSPKSRYSRPSEPEPELTHRRVLRSMPSPNGMPDKKNILSDNSNLQIDNVTYLTRYRLKRLSVEDEELKSLKEITNVSPVILQENKGDVQSPPKIKMAAKDIFVPTCTKRVSISIEKPAILSKDATISDSIQEGKGDLQSPLQIKVAAIDTFVPTRTKRLSNIYIHNHSPTKKPEILSNSQQTLHTKEGAMIGENLSRKLEIDDTIIPSRKKRISTYVRPLKNNDDNNNRTEINNVNDVDEAFVRKTRNSSKPTNNILRKDLQTNQTQVNNVMNVETSKPMRNKRISSCDKVNNHDEINMNHSNSKQEILNNIDKESLVQVRHNINNNDTNIGDFPMVVSYGDIDIFTDKDSPLIPEPENTPINKYTVNKSHINTSNNFFWQMLEKYCRRHTYKRKSRLLTDSAVNTLCKTLEVNIARITELPDGFVLFEMKELAKSICNEDRKVLVSAILTYLMSPKRHTDTECRKYTPPAPIMSKQEQVLLFVLDYIREERQYNIFYDVLKSIEYTLFRLNHTPDFVHVENLSHFYAVICRFVGSVAQLRTFIIDAMYCMSYKAIIVVNQCLDVWMHTLPLAHLRTAKNPLVVCIVYLLYYFKCENSTSLVATFRNTLKRRYCYEMTEWNEAKLLQFIRTSIMSIKENPLETKNMRSCLILLAKREGVKWCQKNIIEKMLIPIISNPSTPERVKRFSISLLGPIMKPYSNNMKIHCEIVIDKLISLVNTQSCSHNMEETVFRSLMYLNKHNTHKVARALLSWTPKEKVSNDFYSHVVDYITEKSFGTWLKILKKSSEF